MADPMTIQEMPMRAFLAANGSEFVKGKVLDVGCGRKPYKRLFPECEWVGLDFRPIGDIEGDAHEIPQDDETYDTVLCSDLLHLCIFPMVVVKECARVLKPGGYLLLSAPNAYAEDGESLWGVHVRALDLCVSQAGLVGVHLETNGKTFTQEWRDHVQFTKSGVPVHPLTEGWLGQMDTRYPVSSIAVARKDKKEEADAS